MKLRILATSLLLASSAFAGYVYSYSDTFLTPFWTRLTRLTSGTSTARSSRRLQDEFSELRKKYWGEHLWARGYFCATVGAVDEKTIREYIENQKWDEEADGFKITAPTEP